MFCPSNEYDWSILRFFFFLKKTFPSYTLQHTTLIYNIHLENVVMCFFFYFAALVAKAAVKLQSNTSLKMIEAVD